MPLTITQEWIIRVQDAMPTEMRNSDAWKNLLPFVAGTGREFEKERLALIMVWMWETVLPSLQPIADKHKFGEEWKFMCKQKDYESAKAAYAATKAADRTANAVVYAANAAYAAMLAADAVVYAAYAATKTVYAEDVANAVYAAVDVAANAVYALGNVANVSADAANAWRYFEPCALLRKLIAVTVEIPV